MKHKKHYDIGQTVKIVSSNDALEILKTISAKTWVYDVPSVLVELIDNNFETALETVKYVPNAYFKLNDKFKNDKKLINATITSFFKHNRIFEINIWMQPLTKRKNLKER